MFKLSVFQLVRHGFFGFLKGIFLYIETFLRGFRTLFGLQNHHESFIWGRENLDRHLKIPVKKWLHEIMKFSGNKRNNLFILIRTFPAVVLLQNTTMNPQTLFLHFLSCLLCFDTSKTAKKFMNESGNFVV